MNNKIKRPKKDLTEIFGYAPDDLSEQARTLWSLGACPFTNKPCVKGNHDRTITYGTCSVTSNGSPCVICPNRLYEENYKVLRTVANETFGNQSEFLSFEEYVPRRTEDGPFIVSLGQGSGKEVQLGRSFSMDWILARIYQGKLTEYVGIEVQSIDITGNYRDAWYAYKNLQKSDVSTVIPQSAHGLNWANVYKRLIPQLIRKGLIYSRSTLVSQGLYFILPEVVYKRFEEVVGSDISTDHDNSPSTLSIHTYELSKQPKHGHMRSLLPVRSLKISLDDFSKRFINGPNLPSGQDLDNAVRRALGCSQGKR